MKYICQIIGDGSEDNPFRPAIADYPLSWTAEIKTGDDGRPLESSCVVAVSGDVSLFASDNRIEAQQ